MSVPELHVPSLYRLHGTVDSIGIRLGALIIPKYFRDGIDSPTVADHLDAVELDVPELRTEGEYDVSATTLVGDLDATVRLASWTGPDAPTIVYHHGAGEVPYDTSFDRIFPKEDLKVNLFAVRAPFHDSTASFKEGIRTLSNLVAMLAVSVEVIEAVVDHTREETDGSVTVAGTSLGGFVTNLHHIHYGSVDASVPLLSGLAMDDVFLDSIYSKGVSPRAKEDDSEVRQVLNFVDAFAETEPGTVHPLLARFDRIVRYDVQRASYGDRPVAIINRGHVTGALASTTLRQHVLSCVG